VKLITAHRITIGVAVAFCLFFARHQWVCYQNRGGTGTLMLSLGFLVVGVALLWYLATLRRHVKIS